MLTSHNDHRGNLCLVLPSKKFEILFTFFVNENRLVALFIGTHSATVTVLFNTISLHFCTCSLRSLTFVLSYPSSNIRFISISEYQIAYLSLFFNTNLKLST